MRNTVQHSLIGVMIKGATAKAEKRKVQYRSFKHFDEARFDEDVGQIPFHEAYIFDDVDDICWAHEWLLTEVINEHAPMEERMSKARKPPYMNVNYVELVLKSACSSIDLKGITSLINGNYTENKEIM